MKKFKKIYFLFLRQLLSAFTRKRVAAGYLVGIVSSLMTGVQYNQFLGTHTANLAESFIQHYATFGNVTVMLLGFILAMSDAPFVYTDSFMMIHRAGRKNWYCSMWGYIIVQGILYYGCSLLVNALCLIRKGYFDNVWSRALINYADSTVFRNNIAPPPGQMIQDYTPCSAALHTFLLFFLYSMLLAGILFALNLFVHTAVGTITVAVIHFLGVLVYTLGFIGSLIPWSYVINAMFSYHMDEILTLLHSYVFFALSIYIVYLIGNFGVSRADFHLLESGEADG